MKFIFSFIENNNFLYLHNVWKQSKKLPKYVVITNSIFTGNLFPFPFHQFIWLHKKYMDGIIEYELHFLNKGH